MNLSGKSLYHLSALRLFSLHYVKFCRSAHCHLRFHALRTFMPGHQCHLISFFATFSTMSFPKDYICQYIWTDVLKKPFLPAYFLIPLPSVVQSIVCFFEHLHRNQCKYRPFLHFFLFSYSCFLWNVGNENEFLFQWYFLGFTKFQHGIFSIFLLSFHFHLPIDQIYRKFWHQQCHLLLRLDSKICFCNPVEGSLILEKQSC